MVEKTMNKHVFVWVGAFLFGLFGVDRFMRGQIGIGILKLVIEAGTFGLWALIDFLIAVKKAYSDFSGTNQITFINGHYAKWLMQTTVANTPQ